MDLYLDTRDRTFAVAAPSDIESRTVVVQTIPPALPAEAVLALMSAMVAQSGLGLDLVYKISIAV